MIGNYSHRNGINYEEFLKNTINSLYVDKIFEYLFILILNQYNFCTPTQETPGGENSNYLHKD